jgi:hypothetical protein
MGQERRVYLQGRKVYGCKLCRTHLSSVENLMSKVRPPLLISIHWAGFGKLRIVLWLPLAHL